MTTPLSASQLAILSHAVHSTNGQLDWFPDSIKGGARKKVIDAMFSRALIINDGTNWIVANEGYEALGGARPAPALTKAEIAQHGASQVLADEVGSEDPTEAEIDASHDTEAKPRRTRDNTKQAAVIAMLKGDGATIAQICAATGWMAHTVRGTFAGAFKKKLGLNVVSSKGEGDRVYRIVD